MPLVRRRDEDAIDLEFPWDESEGLCGFGHSSEREREIPFRRPIGTVEYELASDIEMVLLE